ncbi:hypothetical protein GALMADRAFT_69951 [Galerina marginata CBS 339.88]|uniref:Pentatricopeptide repeat-containing protein-mitochondrial domain-containing protein n=1 Tax=Galerina marginata (strain CBS 339.88) TaxID=685588 RepID=A0A067T912_GALM3|nr:hypothetical protein GALMADRAFT_69951 [Galerina marginata CBS 339.88]
MTHTPTDFTMQVMAAANAGRFSDGLQAAARMKAARIIPDAPIYDALINLAARHRSWLFAWAILDDMLKAGIPPIPATFAHLINAQRDRPFTNLWTALQQMDNFGINPNGPIYTAIINCLVGEGNVEMAIQCVFSMKKQGIVPELAAAQAVVTLAADCGYSRLAIELATYFEDTSVRQLDNSAWMACLYSSARNLYIEGVMTCWPRVVNELNLVPNEGVCLAVLDTAARHGSPDIATDVIRVLKLAGVEWQEFHFAALIEAFCRNDQLKEALITLAIMRTSGILPAETTTSFIFDCINDDVNSLDSAWSLIDEIYVSKSGLDIEALKVAVHASIFLGDLQRAVGIYKAFSNYELAPDLATFNMLLQGCIGAQHRELGDLLLADMKEAKIKPNEETYRKMIHLCLTQEVYEDAFYYLEEMKAAGYIPPRTVYETLVDKCASVGDVRGDLVLQEMRECGYRLDNTRTQMSRGNRHTGGKR